MSKNRRFSEKERERDKVKEPRRKQKQKQRKRRRLENQSPLSLSLSLSFSDARASAKELRVLVFIRVFYLIFPFEVSPQNVWGKQEMRRRLQTLLFLVLFAFFAEQTTIANEEEQQEARTSKCLDRGYDPDVIRCDYCRFAMKDALGGEHDELVRECLECCKENDEDGDASSMMRESGVKFDRATITACS